MDCMRLKKIKKKFDLFGIQTYPIPLNPHGLRANRTSSNWVEIHGNPVGSAYCLTSSQLHTHTLIHSDNFICSFNDVQKNTVHDIKNSDNNIIH